MGQVCRPLTVTFNCVSQMSFSIVPFCDMHFSVTWDVSLYRPTTNRFESQHRIRPAHNRLNPLSHKNSRKPEWIPRGPDLSVPVPRGRSKIESNNWSLQAEVADKCALLGWTSASIGVLTRVDHAHKCTILYTLYRLSKWLCFWGKISGFFTPASLLRQPYPSLTFTFRTKPERDLSSEESTLFWVAAQRVVVISYQCFRTTHWSHLQGSRIQKKTFCLNTEFI